MSAPKKDQVASAIWGTLESPNCSDSNFEAANVVDGLYSIAKALHHVAKAIEKLGNADAATPMGGLEALGQVMKEGFHDLATALDGAGQSVSGSIDSMPGTPGVVDHEDEAADMELDTHTRP